VSVATQFLNVYGVLQNQNVPLISCDFMGKKVRREILGAEKQNVYFRCLLQNQNAGKFLSA